MTQLGQVVEDLAVALGVEAAGRLATRRPGARYRRDDGGGAQRSLTVRDPERRFAAAARAEGAGG